MDGQLSKSDQTQLEQWIGQGPKMFTLLYSAKKDGCSGEKFHEKCDYQGATLTVVYNRCNSVFGGYATTSWAGEINGYIRDDKAFLFQLKYSGKETFRKFHNTSTTEGIFSNSFYGPVFGGKCGHDMSLFSGTIHASKGNFLLNGAFDVNRTYSFSGVSSWQQVHNGDLHATDIEVYSVAIKPSIQEPIHHEWRNVPEWNKKLVQELIQEVQSIKPNPRLKIQDYRIVLIGPVGSGKSSFCNTVNSMFRGRITQRAICGDGTHSTTTSYTSYSIKCNQQESTLRMRLCDTRGLRPDLGLDVMEFTYLLNGHIPENYKFNAERPIVFDDPAFVMKPGLQDRIHCVVFVVDASTLQKLDPKVMDKIKIIRTSATKIEIPQALLLTKIDIEDKAVAKNLETVFSSSAIETKVQQASDMFGFPKNHVFPLKNYENEMMLEDGVNILALLALRQILYFAEDYMDNQITERIECHDEGNVLDLETASESI